MVTRLIKHQDVFNENLRMSFEKLNADKCDNSHLKLLNNRYKKKLPRKVSFQSHSDLNCLNDNIL